MIAAGLPICLPAQEASDKKSDLIEPAAMTALDNMGTYLRTLKDFQVKAAVSSEDVLADGEKLTFTHMNTHNSYNSGYYGGGGCCYHSVVGVGGAVAVAAAATAIAVVVGSMVHTLPPNCSTIVANGVTYQQCGSTYYQPQFSGAA